MIKEEIKGIVNEQRTDYLSRLDIMNNTFTKEELQDIEKRDKLKVIEVLKIRQHVLWLEGEENNASFEEWIIYWMWSAKNMLRKWIKEHMNKIKEENNLNEDFILWMHEVYKLIK